MDDRHDIIERMNDLFRRLENGSPDADLVIGEIDTLIRDADLYFQNTRAARVLGLMD